MLISSLSFNKDEDEGELKRFEKRFCETRLRNEAFALYFSVIYLGATVSRMDLELKPRYNPA